MLCATPCSSCLTPCCLHVCTTHPSCPAGLESLWPRLASLEVVGWALDSASMAAIKQLEGLSSIRLQGGRDPGTALSARLALQLLDKPGLSKLVLLEVSIAHMWSKV
jgi:hypothetical protein